MQKSSGCDKVGVSKGYAHITDGNKMDFVGEKGVIYDEKSDELNAGTYYGSFTCRLQWHRRGSRRKNRRGGKLDNRRGRACAFPGREWGNEEAGGGADHRDMDPVDFGERQGNVFSGND